MGHEQAERGVDVGDARGERRLVGEALDPARREAVDDEDGDADRDEPLGPGEVAVLAMPPALWLSTTAGTCSAPAEGAALRSPLFRALELLPDSDRAGWRRAREQDDAVATIGERGHGRLREQLPGHISAKSDQQHTHVKALTAGGFPDRYLLIIPAPPSDDVQHRPSILVARRS